MASPSAILSILVNADTALAQAKLSAYQKELDKAAISARKGIEMRLGGTFDPKAFAQYQAATDRVLRRTADRAAFKAELGANFSPAGFAAYERAVAKAQASQRSLSDSATAAGKSLTSTGKTLSTHLTLPIAAAAAGSIDLAFKFQSAMERIHTQAGASQTQVNQLSSAVLKLAGPTATAPNTLADGMYHVVSSLNATVAPARRVSTELAVLKVAAEGAKVGSANLVDVTNALDAAVVSGIKGAQNYNQAMGALNSTVGAGDMTMQNLADALGTGVLAPMKRFGLSLQDVGAALAVFGDNNIRGADAATKLSSAVRIMAAPSKQASAALGEVHLSTLQLANDMRQGGLIQALTDLRQHLQASGDTASQQGLIITRAFGGRQSLGVQVLLGQLDRLRAKYGDVGKGADKFGSDFLATAHNAQFQWQQLLSTMEENAVKLGTTLLPVVKDILGDVSSIVGWFNGLPGPIKRVTEGGLALAAVIGPIAYAVGTIARGFGAIAKLGSLLGLGGLVKGAAGAAGAAGTAEVAGGAAVGGEAATGGGLLAGAGALLASPVGIAAAGALVTGGLAVAFAHFFGNSEKWGTEFSNKFLKGMNQNLPNLGGALHHQLEKAADAFHSAAKPSGALPGLPGAPANDQQVQADAKRMGKVYGEAVVAGLKSVKDLTPGILLGDFMMKLKRLPAQARPEAAKTMIEFATGLEQQGKIPMSALQRIVRGLESQIPGLGNYLVQEGGVKTAQGLADAFRFTQASANLRQALSSYRQQFGDWQVSSKVTETNIWQNAATAMDHLHQIIKTSTGQAKKDALANLQDLQQNAKQLLTRMASDAADKMAEAAQGIASGSQKAESQATSAFNGLISNIAQAMHDGLLKVNTGTQLIAQALNQQLKAFGAKPLTTPSAIQWANWAYHGAANTSSGGIGHRATGGMMVNHPMYMVGEEAPHHPEVVIATNPAYRKRNLGLWAHAGRALGIPGFALGGIVTASEYSGSAPNPRDPGHRTADGSVGFAELSNPPSSLNFSALGNLPFGYPLKITFGGRSIVAPKIDVGAGGPGLNGHIRAVDLTMPAARALSFPGLADVMIASGTGQALTIGGGGGGAAGAAASAFKFGLPKVTGGGTVGTIVQAAFKHLADAANSYLGTHQPQLSVGPAGANAASYPGLPGGLGSFDGLPVASWIVPILQWAASHGWGGHITSGYRPPGQVISSSIVAPQGHSNHNFTAYPGGAIDVGSPSDRVDGQALASVLARYPGHPNLVWGGPVIGDWGHFSATGHKMGGIIGKLPFAGAFAGGGVVPGSVGQPVMGLLHGGETVWPPTFAGQNLFGGISGWGWTPTLSQHFRELEKTATRAATEIAKLTKELKNASGAQKTALEDQLKAAKKEQKQATTGLGKVMGQFAGIPSQGIRGQIQMAGLQNRVALAQNAGNVGGQQRGLRGELKLEQKWLKDDQKQLRQINRALRTRGLSRKQRAGLLQDKLALLQEIGTIEGDIGSTQQSLSDLTSPTATGGTDTSTGDLASAIANMQQAADQLRGVLQEQTAYMKQVAAVETQTAIKALADVISGQIGGSYLSRASGSAGTGLVATY